MNESAKYLHLTKKYLTGNGVDIGSGGWPVVPHAIQIEQPADKFLAYNQRPINPDIEWQGDIFHLPFQNNVLDFVYSSHLIEDFSQEVWRELFLEWSRCLKVGGFMVLLVPEVTRWAAAIKRGQIPNCSHYAPEPSVGDMSRVASTVAMLCVEEGLTNVSPEDFSILGVFTKP